MTRKDVRKKSLTQKYAEYRARVEYNCIINKTNNKPMSRKEYEKSLYKKV